MEITNDPSPEVSQRDVILRVEGIFPVSAILELEGPFDAHS